MNHITMSNLKLINESGMGQKLPRFCYGMLLENNQLVVIERGDMGYIALPYRDGKVTTTEAMVRDMNEQIGVTAVQATCMRDGSQFGWHVPGADPANYDAAGRYVSKGENSDA